LAQPRLRRKAPAGANKVSALMREQGLSEEVAARRVLGMSYDEIGQAVGRHWKLPASILEGIAPLPDGPMKPSMGRHQVLANPSLKLYEAVRNSPREDVGRAATEIAWRSEKCVNLPGPLLAFNPNVFRAALPKAADILVSNTSADNSRIPDSYRRLVGARPILLLITVGNRCVALICADWRKAPLQLPQTLGLVKSPRNQITMAMRTQGRN